jgi:hypothetical protein
MDLSTGIAPILAGSEPAVLLLDDKRIQQIMDLRCGLAPQYTVSKTAVLL